jgi:hypothetical protein
MNVKIGGYGSVPEKDGLQTGAGMFLPRLGVAYKATNSTVVRLGGGIGADSNNWRFLRNDYPAVIISDWTPQNNGGSSTYNQYAPAASFTGANGANSAVATNPYKGLPTGIVNVAIPNAATTGYVPLVPGVSTGTVENPKFRRGYIYSYNLSVEQRLAGFVIDAAYVGARQIRPLINLGVNVAPAGGGTAGELLNVKFASQLPAGKYYGGVSEMIPLFHSYYDSLQTKVTRHIGQASTVGVVYTWGKAIDYEDNEELNSPLWQYPAYFARDKALAGFDRKYNFETYWLYDLPFGKGQRWANHGIAAAVAGGWTLTGVLSRLSGTPFTVTDGNSTRAGALNAPGNQLTPNIIGALKTTKSKPVKTDKQNSCVVGNLSCSFFDTSAFAPVTAAATFGNAGRGIMRGPGYFDLDTSVFRNFKIRESLTFQFEANAYGLTNTPHFANPTSDINSSTFGMVTGELATSNASLGGSGGERQWWFGGKFVF